MTERPENLTGTVTYWNGASGWIKRDDAGGTTAESHDLIVRAEDIASGMIENGTAVSFWADADYGIARDVKVIGGADVDPPAPDSPPDPPPPDSPP